MDRLGCVVAAPLINPTTPASSSHKSDVRETPTDVSLLAASFRLLHVKKITEGNFGAIRTAAIHENAINSFSAAALLNSYCGSRLIRQDVWLGGESLRVRRSVGPPTSWERRSRRVSE